MPKGKHIKVVHRKLGRERAWGIADDFIELDVRLKGKKHLEVLLHEALHVLFPAMSENEVIDKSIILTNTLWGESYRRIDNDCSQPMQSE